MFCYQCEQTASGSGCTVTGICGKNPETAALQDLLIDATKGISKFAHRAGQRGVRNSAVDRFTIEALFTTVTNVNFDPARLATNVREVIPIREQAKADYERACQAAGESPETLNGAATWTPEADLDGLVKQGELVSVRQRLGSLGEDITGLQELLIYGIKGMAAYAKHAEVLGHEDPEVYAFIHEGMDFVTKPNPTVDELFTMNMRCGEATIKVLALLDKANTETYGNPEPTEVLWGHIPGKAILVSGHDLKDLDLLLKQTEGKGINVYTHGEMLPAHSYPELKKHKHFAGHYGGAWMRQRPQFSQFPGPILMTTNCIQEPREDYKARIFTCGLVAWPGVAHIADQDFTAVIEAALAAPGFEDSSPAEKQLTVGFGHHAVLGVADTVIDAVKSGALRHFFLIGGCDGAEGGRNYYSDLGKALPDDTVLLTLGCGKFRLLDEDMGTLGGLPRRLDMGQCNDAYSAIKVAQTLAGAFETDVNGLPLSIVLSWFEQKAVCVLLALLHLGVKDIRVGPALPAFITPAVLNVLVEKFAIKPIGTVEEDLEAMLNKNAA
jgi:hydroxylamine reductase